MRQEENKKPPQICHAPLWHNSGLEAHRLPVLARVRTRHVTAVNLVDKLRPAKPAKSRVVLSDGVTTTPQIIQHLRAKARLDVNV